MTTRNQRHADLQAFLGRAGDRLGLAAFLGALAGIGAGRIDEGDHRQVEAVRHLHQPHGLAIALGTGHAEIALDAAAGIVALFMADHHDRAILEPREATQNRLVLGEFAIPGKRRVFLKQRFDIVAAMRAVRMPRHLAFAPGRQLLVEILEHVRGLAVESRGLGLDIHLLV